MRFSTTNTWEYDGFAYVETEDAYYKMKLEPPKNPYIFVNNELLAFEEIPKIEDDRLLVPMRFLFEQMGAEVEWDGKAQSATAVTGDNAVTFLIDNVKATVNDKMETMDVPARLINSTTMIPLRFLSENLGYTVTWDQESNAAFIEK